MALIRCVLYHLFKYSLHSRHASGYFILLYVFICMSDFINIQSESKTNVSHLKMRNDFDIKILMSNTIMSLGVCVFLKYVLS